MSPLDLPGAPLKPPGSKNTIKCPRCSREHSGPMVIKALKLRLSKDVTVKCKKCGHEIKLKRKKK